MQRVRCKFAIVTLIAALCGNSVSRGDDPGGASSGGPFNVSSKIASKSELPPKEAAKACLVTADEMVRSGYRREAAALYERARQLDPSQQQVCRYLAVLYDEIGTDSQALAEYNHAVRLAPKDPDLLNDFGYFYYRRHDMHQAEQWFCAAIAQSPQHERAWVNLGLTLGETERYQESFDAFSKVLSTAAAHSNVGMILARHGRTEEASRALKQALILDPSIKQPRALLAYLDAPQSIVQKPNLPASSPQFDRPLR